jgi:Putative Ig domain
MQSRLSDFVRAFLPLLPLAMCPGCGEGSPDSPALSAAPSVTPPLAAAPELNRAPTIHGDANKVAHVGREYAFQPEWDDADGDAVVFTATNLPPWADLDPKTGRIHGTPAPSDIGAYESISITVADASHRVKSRDFEIAVVGESSGVARLRWPTPVSKVDGSVLDDLAGYRILYGRDPEDLDQSVFIPDPNAHSFEFATLESGTWYFSIVAVNAEGLEGPATPPAMKAI